MTPQDATQSDLSPLDEELLAYLEDQLTPAERTRVERRLASDEAYRVRLALLERSWELLDALPRPEPTADFARTTVEIAAVSAREDWDQAQSRQSRLTRLRYAAGGLLALGAAALGFVGVRFIQTADDRRLVQDLPVIERLEQYRSLDDAEFLKRLAEAGLFPEEPTDAL